MGGWGGADRDFGKEAAAGRVTGRDFVIYYSRARRGCARTRIAAGQGARMDTEKGIPGTGLPSLDQVIQRVIPGDNIVWRIDLIDDYSVLVKSFSENALRNGRK